MTQVELFAPDPKNMPLSRYTNEKKEEEKRKSWFYRLLLAKG
jgi:hypothetical protein